eukprot:TRINITY_DN10290_c0_g3_i1.p1 TRINITY_DN10290_c0_g3~~TRINITY_DN10290_c0_g3_i1.p1  ORF type:complete len:952 (+),score=229.77 TRINITY_DN10290_c0_g3_i1:20-2875(+)
MLLLWLCFLRAISGCYVDLSSTTGGVEWTACRLARGSHSEHCIAHAQMPGTALVNLFMNGTWPHMKDLWMDDNLDKIDDISVTGKDFWTFHYSSKVRLPRECIMDSHSLILEIQQVNYRADVFINHKLVNPLGPRKQAVGMFQRYVYDLTSHQHHHHLDLGITVHPPDHPGNGSSSCHICGQGGNHKLAQDVGSQDTAGWDWISPVPDRNTGISGGLSIRSLGSGGSVAIRDPILVTKSIESPVIHPDSVVDVLASVTVSVLKLQAASGVEGVLVLEIPELNVESKLNVLLEASASPADWTEITFPELLKISNVKLWWPHTLGSPVLYAARLTFVDSKTSQVSDVASWRVGFRTISSEVDPVMGGRVFFVNGQRIYLEGGNWISTDQFNRFNGDAQRYFDEVRMHQQAGLNVIRLWGGNGGHGSSLYSAGDELGVLFQMEFWMSGDNNGRWAGSYDWPLDHELFLQAAADTVRMIRGHPSVLFYCGGNEIWPASVSPPHDIAVKLPEIISTLDPSERTFVPSSMSDPSDFDPTWALCPKDGPYGIMDEREFFERNPGMYIGSGTHQERASTLQIAFQPEIGNSACPEFESMLRFLSPSVGADFPKQGALGGDANDVNPVWNFHKYQSFTDSRGYDHIYAYGAPSNLKEYAFRAQIAQYRQYQALFEGFAQHMFEWYQTVMMWKTQSPWPALRGFLYDSYLATNGAFWGVRSATRTWHNLHVQLNQLSGHVSVLNRGFLDFGDPLIVHSSAYEVSTGKLVFESVQTLPNGSLARSVQVLPEKLIWPSGLADGSVLLWRFGLKRSGNDSDMSSLTSSDYWLSNLDDDTSAAQNYSALASQELPVVSLDVRVKVFPDKAASKQIVEVLLELPAGSDAVAFMCRASLRYSAHCASTTHDNRVLPAWQSDNYFSLIPGESKVISIEYGAASSFDCQRIVYVDGWNVQEVMVLVSTL